MNGSGIDKSKGHFGPEQKTVLIKFVYWKYLVSI